MEIIVDGHNLMFFAARQDERYRVERGEPARMALLDLLSRYQAAKGDRVLCAFDGGAVGAHLPRRSFGRGLEVLYAAPDSDADTEIKEVVAHHREPRRVNVITADNAVRAYVVRFGAGVTSPREFLAEVSEALSPNRQPDEEPTAKYEGPDEDEVKFWSGVFGEEE